MKRTRQLFLPNDLKKVIKKSIIKRIIKCIVLLVIFGTVLLLWGDKLINFGTIQFKASCYIVIMLIPFFVTGVPLKMIGRSYRGKIEKIDIETIDDNASYVKFSREHQYVKNSIYLWVDRYDGKLIRIKAYEGDAKLQQNLDKYHVGDTIFHLYGSKHTVVIPKATDSYVQCSVCGDLNSKNDDLCRTCAHTLIKE